MSAVTGCAHQELGTASRRSLRCIECGYTYQPLSAPPLPVVAPRIGSRILAPSRWSSRPVEIIVREVSPHVLTGLPEVVGVVRETHAIAVRSTDWRPLGAVDIRCGLCYAILRDGETIAVHARISDHPLHQAPVAR